MDACMQDIRAVLADEMRREEERRQQLEERTKFQQLQLERMQRLLELRRRRLERVEEQAQKVCMRTCLFVRFFFFCVCVSVSLCVSVCLLCVSVCLCVCVSVSVSVRLCLCLCVSVCLCTCLCLMHRECLPLLLSFPFRHQTAKRGRSQNEIDSTEGAAKGAPQPPAHCKAGRRIQRFGAFQRVSVPVPVSVPVSVWRSPCSTARACASGKGSRR